MATVIDGPTLRVTLDVPVSGFVTVDAVADLYSFWKRWVKLSDGSKYPLLFDITGGDPIPGSQFISPSMFLRNDLGWRLQTTDADQSATIIGNLYPRDETLDMFVPRAGRQVIVNLNLTANPRDLSSSKIDDIHGQVQREVWIDPQFPTNGNFGYQHHPFNTWTDGVDYAEANDILTLALKNDATVDRQLKNFEIRGIAFPNLDLNGQDLDKTTIRRMNVTGNNLGQMILEDCAITNVLSGEMIAQRVGITGTLGLRDGGSTLLSEVDVFTPGSPFTIDFLTGVAGSTIALTRVSGDMTVINMNHVDDVCHIHMSHGTITIAASCTVGSMVIMGDGDVIDNSAGTVVNKDALIEPVDIRDSRKRLMNREYTNPTTNKLEQQNDTDTGIEKQADIFKDDGVTPWDGTGPIRRRDKMV